MEEVDLAQCRSERNNSGFLGVTAHGNRFHARHSCGGKRYSLGVYDTAEEAAQAVATGRSVAQPKSARPASCKQLSPSAAPTTLHAGDPHDQPAKWLAAKIPTMNLQWTSLQHDGFPGGWHLAVLYSSNPTRNDKVWRNPFGGIFRSCVAAQRSLTCTPPPNPHLHSRAAPTGALNSRTARLLCPLEPAAVRRADLLASSFYNEDEARALLLGTRLVVADADDQWFAACVVDQSPSQLCVQWLHGSFLPQYECWIDHNDEFRLSKCASPESALESSRALAQLSSKRFVPLPPRYAMNGGKDDVDLTPHITRPSAVADTIDISLWRSEKGSTGYLGVSQRANGAFRASHAFHGRREELGIYANVEAAATAVARKYLAVHGAPPAQMLVRSKRARLEQLDQVPVERFKSDAATISGMVIDSPCHQISKESPCTTNIPIEMSESVKTTLENLKNNILPGGWSLEEKSRPKKEGKVHVDRYWFDGKGNRYRSIVECKRALMANEFMEQQAEAAAAATEEEEPAAEGTEPAGGMLSSIMSIEAKVTGLISTVPSKQSQITSWLPGGSKSVGSSRARVSALKTLFNKASRSELNGQVSVKRFKTDTQMSRSRSVQVWFDDQWYDATIVSRDHAFQANVCYTDGSREASIDGARIRAKPAGSPRAPFESMGPVPDCGRSTQQSTGSIRAPKPRRRANEDTTHMHWPAVEAQPYDPTQVAPAHKQLQNETDEEGATEVVCVVCREINCDPGLSYLCDCKFGYHVQCFRSLLQSDPKWRKECPGCRQLFIRLPLALRKQMNNATKTQRDLEADL